ncbi:hypothetical protein CHARACLAT_023180 [Characodon lateralis]|uniref:Uncharacterized protein n=1 Tax=Characodon lateralis TaxID=208331 RepID=A0ABU7EF30_9TELE|nr:hypothetical protein [Characodon lateralis]
MWEDVEVVEEYKYLGVHLDNRLEWRCNCNDVMGCVRFLANSKHAFLLSTLNNDFFLATLPQNPALWIVRFIVLLNNFVSDLFGELLGLNGVMHVKWCCSL